MTFDGMAIRKRRNDWLSMLTVGTFSSVGRSVGRCTLRVCGCVCMHVCVCVCVWSKYGKYQE